MVDFMSGVVITILSPKYAPRFAANDEPIITLFLLLRFSKSPMIIYCGNIESSFSLSGSMPIKLTGLLSLDDDIRA